MHMYVLKFVKSFVRKRDFAKFDHSRFFDQAKQENFHHSEGYTDPHVAAHHLENLIIELVDTTKTRPNLFSS